MSVFVGTLIVYIGEIRERTLKDYIEFSSEGKSLNAGKILDRVDFFKRNPGFGVDLSGWNPDESINDSPIKKLMSAARYLQDEKLLDNSVIIPSSEVLAKNKEKKDEFLLALSRALRPKLSGECKIEEENASGQSTGINLILTLMTNKL